MNKVKPPGSGSKKGQKYNTTGKLLEKYTALKGVELIEDIVNLAATMSPRERMTVMIALLPYCYRKQAPDMTVTNVTINNTDKVKQLEEQYKAAIEVKNEIDGNRERISSQEPTQDDLSKLAIQHLQTPPRI